MYRILTSDVESTRWPLAREFASSALASTELERQRRMQTKLEREVELRTLLQSPQGMQSIIQLYHDRVTAVARTVTLGRIGLLACQMIPRIVDAEFPAGIPGT